MKKVYLIRHAKSSWKDLSLKDFDRPLNKRGLKDAPKMGKILLNNNIKIDHIYCSKATRAKMTSTLLCKALNYKNKIDYLDSLYEAHYNDIIDLIKDTENIYDSIGFICHNPTLNMLASHFIPDFNKNIPTCGVFAVSSNCQSWQKFDVSDLNKLFFYFPKEIR